MYIVSTCTKNVIRGITVNEGIATYGSESPEEVVSSLDAVRQGLNQEKSRCYAVWHLREDSDHSPSAMFAAMRGRNPDFVYEIYEGSPVLLGEKYRNVTKRNR